MGNTGGKALPYAPSGDRLPLRFSSPWSIFEGASTADTHAKVTIFKFDKKNADSSAARPSQVTLAQNYVKRLKTLRHPHCLRLLDSLETEEAIMMVTERAVPLSLWLDRNRPSADEARDGFESGCVWGLYCLAEALSFLNGDCKLLHGNLHPDAVFVTKGGSWKLAGFDLCCPLVGADGDSPDRFLTDNDAAGPCPDLYRSPERSARDWGSVNVARTAACLDAFACGVLICDVFSPRRLRSHDDVKEVLASRAPSVPTLLKPLLPKLLAPSPRARPADYAAQLLASEYFRHPLVGTMVFLDALALKEPADKQRFFRSLPSVLSRVPDHIAKYRILPALMTALEYGAAGGGGTVVLGPILEIGSRLPNEEYGREIIPCVVRLFNSSDRATRVQLLHHLPGYIDRLSDDLINREVFPQLLNGFTDTNPVLREATIKAAVPLAPRLSEANRYGVLLRALKRTVSDAEPAIRVNTVICLGRIAHTIADAAQREDLLSSVLMKILRDGFPAARVAGLKAMAFCVSLSSEGPAGAGGGAGGVTGAAGGNRPPGAATGAGAVASSGGGVGSGIPFGYWSADLIAKKVMTAACYLTLDGYGEARDAAFTLLQAASKVLQTHSERLWVEERARAAAEAAGGGAAGQGAEEASPAAGAVGGAHAVTAGGAAAKGAAGKAAEAVAGALGWAVSSLASRIIPSGNMDDTGASPPAGAGTPAAGSPVPAAAAASAVARASAPTAAAAAPAHRPSASASSLSAASTASASASFGSFAGFPASASSGSLSAAAPAAGSTAGRAAGLGASRLGDSGSRGGAAASAGVSAGGAGGGWGDDAFDDLLDGDDAAGKPTGSTGGHGGGIRAAASAQPLAAAPRPSGTSAASGGTVSAAGAGVPPRAMKLGGAAIGAIAAPVSASSAGVAAADGWGDDAWGSLLGDGDAAGGKGASSATSAGSAAAVKPKQQFVLSAGDEDAAVGSGRAGASASARGSAVSASAAPQASPSAGTAPAGGMRLGAVKKAPSLAAGSTAPAKSGGGGWEDW